jgi:AcrR family transcriptional regulator
MSPKVPEAYLEARRKEILWAAYKCFVEKGFNNTTMQDIYDTTKLSPGAVYNYFSSKEDIVIAAVEMFNDWSIASIEPLLKENTDESFIKIFKFWFDSIMQSDVRDHYGVQMSFYAEAARNKDIREAMSKSMDSAGVKLAGPVQRSQSAGLFNSKLNPVSIAHIMVGMVFTAAIHKMIEPDFNLESYRKACEAMLSGTFATPPAKTHQVIKPKLKI